jgi:hypothetical protein
LDFDRAPDGVDHAGEFGQETVTGVFYDPAPVLCDLGIDQLVEVGLESLMGSLLVLSP